MLPALKLSLDGFDLRDHSLLRRNPPDDESSVAVALPTEMGETQEREGFWFSHASPPRIVDASRNPARRTRKREHDRWQTLPGLHEPFAEAEQAVHHPQVPQPRDPSEQ